ncbi:Tir chaperone protein (CesT) [Herbaspirillum sp. CF444]|uniref:CesT family type III secretion system chaperone n=1 Tax=Herbaspirillum sp. CF444 TaxID=1144319 RepID=UPI0002726337|nr:CesT family type III secretion system chaperone [Herbaspirillum sp. CF444]EJL88950.1 Tir chaperone protein (CesT) [Herbaspirillum sp. CF444]
MSKALFVELASKFCQLARLPEPERLLEGNAIEVDGVDFYLAYDEEEEPDHLVVYCDFGIPPAERRLEAYEALLEVNMAMYGSNPPAFMLSPGKRVALAYHYHLKEIVAEQLMNLCAGVAGQAREWRQDYFLSAAA